MAATTIFSDVSKEVAFANSVKVQRYHGGLSNTLIAGVTAKNIGETVNNVVYLCPIPWYARITDISIVFEAAAKCTTSNPKISLAVRSMKDKCAKNAGDIANLKYTEILGTTNDYNSAKGNKTLADVTLANNNTTEIVIATNIDPLVVADNTAVTVGEEYHWRLPVGMRQLTLAECYSYKKDVSVGSETKEITVFSDNAKGLAAKEQFGMLTAICTTAGSGTFTDAKAIISVTYVDPAPSSISQGSITVNKN